MKETLRAFLLDPPGGVLTTDAERVQYPAASLAMWSGFGAFLVFAPVFALFGHPSFLLVNGAVSASFLVGLQAMWRGRFQAALTWGCFVVCAHAWAATLQFGWAPGFHYQVLLTIVVMALVTPGALRTRGVIAGLFAASYAVLRAVASVSEPAAPLAAWQADTFLLMNAATNAWVLGVVSLYFAHTVDRTRSAHLVAEQALERALEETHAIVDTMADGLVAIDGDGQVRTRNDAYRRLLPDDALPAELLAIARGAMAAQQTHGAELALPEERTGMAVASPLDGGGAVVLVRDITVDKQLDRMKSEFTATVSHELRTPLTSVLGFTRIIQSRLEAKILPKVPLDDDPSARRAVAQVRTNLDIILQEGERLAHLINDVLDLAKLEAGSMVMASEPVDTADLVRHAVSATQGLFVEGPVPLVADLPKTLPWLTGDRDRLTQVLVNLISNAAKFTEVGEVRVTAGHRGGFVELRVIDTGAGIPEGELDAIFERFHQVEGEQARRPQGTGLGLPICRHIVNSHQGTIHAESELGVGTEMVVRLPAVPASQERGLRPPQP